MKLFLSDELGETTLEIEEPSDAIATLLIAHGAGAGMHHPFMVDISKRICDKGVRTIRFNFPYMEEGRKAPGSPKKNIETWNLLTKSIVARYPNQPIFLSGKSYGGRMASHLIATHGPNGAHGIIYFGFPLHAPGRDSKDRAAHLKEVVLPQLFLQGTKDKLANMQLMSEVIDELQGAELVALEEADHSFNVPKRAGISKQQMIEILANHAVNFINKNS